MGFDLYVNECAVENAVVCKFTDQSQVGTYSQIWRQLQIGPGVSLLFDLDTGFASAQVVGLRERAVRSGFVFGSPDLLQSTDQLQ